MHVIRIQEERRHLEVGTVELGVAMAESLTQFERKLSF
jgi:hypothetical protein